MLQIEIIVKNVEEARVAEQHGADVLELIDDFAEGGLSPSASIAKAVCAAVTIPVYVMVRPQGKSFVYSAADREKILAEIAYLRDETQAYGIVFGALTAQHQIDIDLLNKVIDCKGRLALTFHRAIDASIDPIASYQTLLQYPAIDRVLTSGGADTAMAGLEILCTLVQLNQGHTHATILAGSGITPNNAATIIQETGGNAIHVGTGIRSNGKLDPVKLQQLRQLKSH